MRVTARLLLAALSLAACEQNTAPLPARQWNMFDLQQAFVAQTPVLVGAEGLPGGLPYNALVAGSGPVIPIAPAITEGAFSPYVTTNIWMNTPEVWIQPMYILVKPQVDPNTHRWTPLPGAPWVFTVGPTSRFHSPFWRVYWAEVPDSAAPERYTTSTAILNDKLVLHEGPGRLVSVVPLETSVPARPALAPSLTGIKALMVRKIDLLDGEPVGAIDFGADRFEWNQDLEVVEQPFFVFASCAAPDDCQPTGAPNVGGTGPLFANRLAMLPGGRPRFGSFWRLYLVALPGTHQARLFIPPSAEPSVRSDLANKLQGLSAEPIAFTPDPAKVEAMNGHFLQIALDGETCFQSQEAFDKCTWLNSQQAIEANLPAAIRRTGITVTCPFVGYGNMDLVKDAP
jgi:hypothetical protein